MSTLEGALAAAALTVWLAMAGCKQTSKAPIVPGGDAERGKVAVGAYGCGSCHAIPGVRGARGMVGPPLADVGRRVYIAGVVQNDPEHMVRWIIDPPAIDSKTAMPNVGVTERDARDIAEYLYRLRSESH